MSGSCQKIKLRTWPRRDIFSFFSALDQPFYSVCFRVDVTQLHTYTKTHGLSFYYVMTYLVTQAVNEVENLRYTIRDGSVFLLDKRTPSFTYLKKGRYIRQENGRETLGLSIEVNHRLVDGVHLGRFYESLQNKINELE